MKRYLLTVNEEEFNAILDTALAADLSDPIYKKDEVWNEETEKFDELLVQDSSIREEINAIREQMKAQDRTEAIMNAPLTPESVRTLEEMFELKQGIEEDG